MAAYLGHVQLAIIDRLAGGDQTTETLAGIASPSGISRSLRTLAGNGLACVTGAVPAQGRGGRHRDIWSITTAGRQELAKVTVTT